MIITSCNALTVIDLSGGLSGSYLQARMEVQIRTYSPTCLVVVTALTIRCRNPVWGHNFDHYRGPLLLFFSKSLVRKERMDPLSWITSSAVVGREGGNGSSFPNGFSFAAIKRRGRGVCLPSWPFISRYRTKRGSQRDARGSLHISVHSILWVVCETVT